MHSLLSRSPQWAIFCYVFIAGAVNVIAFAPLSIWPVQLLSLFGLFYLLYHAPSVKQVMRYTWLYCFSWMFFGVSWLTVTMFRYGDMPVWLSVAVLALFTASIALIPTLMMGAALRFKPYFSPQIQCLVWIPAFWSGAEWTRGWLFTGFPWLVTGYVHTASPLAGFAPVLGVYGLTWLGAIFAGCAVMLALGQRRYGLLALGLLLAGSALSFIPWTKPNGHLLNVRLLQGNVDQQIKFEREHLIDSLDFYFHAILKQPADLIVTPESALPIPLSSLPPDYLNSLEQFAMQTQSSIALGAFSNDGPDLYANSVFGISPSLGKISYRYDKHHLVPFGEFIPQGFAWFYHYMHIPMGDLQRGSLLATPFAVKDQQILPNICYEDVFGEEIAAKIAHAYFTRQPVPTILLNMTNLSWFGDTWAMPQHVQITQMRTMEMGRPMLRSTNTGITTLVNAQAEVVQQMAPFTRGELTVQVQGYTGLTPYILCGNYLWLGLMSIVMLFGYWRKKTRPSTSG